MKAIMSMAHKVREAAATQFGGKPSDYLMSIALEMAWEAHRTVKEMSMKDRIEQRLINDNGILAGYSYRKNDEGGFDVLRSSAGYAKIQIDDDRVSVGAFGFKSYAKGPVAACKELLKDLLPQKKIYSGYSRDMDESDGGYQEYRK